MFHKKFNCSPFSYISVFLRIGYFRDLLIFNFAIIIFEDYNQDFLIYFWILCHVIDHQIIFQDVLSHRKEFIVISIRWDTMSLRVGMVIFQENNPSFKLVVFAASWELLRCSHEK